MRVFGYSRVSTAEQADEGASLDVQQQQIMGYCLMKGYALAEHFVERGVSGSIPLADRPEEQAPVGTIGKGDIVVSAKLDRAFRSAADALAVLEELKDQGVDLHLIDLGGSVIANGMSKMVFTILTAVAEGERIVFVSGSGTRRHLTSQGIYNGGKRPFGVDIVQDGEIRRMVPNPAERMRAVRKDGATYRAIGAVTGHGPESVMRILARV